MILAINCGFEDVHICRFTQDTDDDFDWDRHSGPTQSADTGPSVDHTMKTDGGMCLFVANYKNMRLEKNSCLLRYKYSPNAFWLNVGCQQTIIDRICESITMFKRDK